MSDTSDTTNAVASISNQSSYALAVYDVFNSTGDPNGVLTYTRLGEIKAHDTANIPTLHSASQLQAMYTGSIADLGSAVYCQFPVAVMAVSKIFDKLSFTVTDDDMKAMIQAFKFIEFTSANAESKITKDFTAALSNKDDQIGAANAFFAGSASFNKVKMKHWHAMVAWQTQFLSPWRGTYYLYNNPKDANSPVSLIAVMSIDSATNQGTIAVPDESGNVSSSSQSAQLAMTGDGKMSETEVGAGGIAVSLQPIWMSLTQKSPDGSINYVIGSAVAGTFNGIAVTGTQEKQDVSGGGETGGGGQSSNLAFGQLTTIIGLLIGAATLWVMYKQGQAGHTQAKNDVENKAAKDGKTDKSEIAKEQNAADATYKEVVSEQAKKASKVMETTTQLSDAKEKYSRTRQQKAMRAKTEETFEKAKQELEQETELEAPDEKLEETATKLRALADSIDSGEIEKPSRDLDLLEKDLSDHLTEHGDEMEANAKKALERIRDNVEKINEESKARQEERVKQQEERNKTVEDPVTVEEGKPGVEAIDL